MELRVEHKGQGHYHLQGQMTMDTVPFAWPELETLWQGDIAPQVLSLSAVDKVDTAGLAWILDIVKQARSHQAELKLSQVPQGLIKLAKISDLEGVLPLE